MFRGSYTNNKMRFDEMPWSFVGTHPNLMEFNAFSTDPRCTFVSSSCKRKSDETYQTPSKQQITEEKMAAHLMGLHISSDYKPYYNNSNNNNNNESNSTTQIDMSDINMDSDVPSTSKASNNVNMTAEELKQRLKNAQKITICEEIRKLEQTESILPKVLLDRIEKPCTALVVWKPPQNIDKFVFKNVKKNFNFSNNNNSNNNINNNNVFQNNNNNYDEMDDEGIEVEDDEGYDDTELFSVKYKFNNNNNNGDDDDEDNSNYNEDLMDMYVNCD